MRRRNFLLLSSLALGACLSPTLPVPPPEAPGDVGLGADGLWELRGRCTPGAVVLVRNLDTGLITGVEDRDANGSYFMRVAGELCARAEIWELIGDDVSGATFFLFEPKVNGLATGECSIPG
jgi:hypothetical protein